MKVQKSFFAVLAFGLAATAPFAIAQTSRAEVKEETKAANQSGGLHRGESPNVQQKLSTDKTRADRKAETNALANSGKLDHGGEGRPQDGDVVRVGTSANRAEVKSETRAAIKAGQIASGEK